MILSPLSDNVALRPPKTPLQPIEGPGDHFMFYMEPTVQPEIPPMLLFHQTVTKEHCVSPIPPFCMFVFVEEIKNNNDGHESNGTYGPFYDEIFIETDLGRFDKGEMSVECTIDVCQAPQSIMLLNTVIGKTVVAELKEDI